MILKLLAIGPLSETTGQREVFYEMNGEVRAITVDDNKASVENVSRPKADSTDPSQVSATMAGVLVEVRVKDGSEVKKGDIIASKFSWLQICKFKQILIIFQFFPP